MNGKLCTNDSLGEIQTNKLLNSYLAVSVFFHFFSIFILLLLQWHNDRVLRFVQYAVAIPAAEENSRITRIFTAGELKPAE